MAAFIGSARIAGVTTGTAAKTMIQLVGAANHRVDIREIGVSFHGTTNTNEPITVELLRQTTAGTMSALTPVKNDDSIAESLLTTAQYNATAEPTAGDVIRSWAVHPQTGMIWQQSKAGEIVLGGGDRLALRVTAGVAVNCDAYIEFEE